MSNMEQTSNQAPSAAYEMRLIKSQEPPGGGSWSRVPVLRRSILSQRRPAASFQEKWLGKMTRDLRKLKQVWAGLQERLAGVFGGASFQNEGGAGLIELLRTNDLVLISKVEAILADSGIAVFLADRHMSALEGSLSFLPRRLLIVADDEARARKILQDAGLGPELRDG